MINAKEFVSSCHNLGDIMGITELTDKQIEKVATDSLRRSGVGKALTDPMEKELDRLLGIRDNPEILEGGKSLLKKYYSQKKGLDKGIFFSKETQKGIMMEDAGIELIDEIVFGSQGIRKNTEQKSNKFIKGTCDLKVDNIVIDNKCPWNMETFLQKVLDTVDKKYIWQLKGYSILFNCDKALLCYTLVDTPNYAALTASFQGKSMEVIEYEATYEHVELQDRIITYEIGLKESDEKEIEAAVLRSRDFLEWYDGEVKKKLGNIFLID